MSHNSDPGHRYRLREIQANGLKQVLTHRDKVSDTEKQCSSAIVLKIVVGYVPYIAKVSLEGHSDPSRQASWAHGS